MPWDPEQERLQLQISPELKERLQQLADEEERSVAWIVRKLLEDGLKSRGHHADSPQDEDIGKQHAG